jgi:hypothetical protein
MGPNQAISQADDDHRPGTQGIPITGPGPRAQVERLSQQAEDAAEPSRLLNEKRNAYLAVLYYSQLEMRRAKYEREGEQGKLREVEDKWPKGERVLCRAPTVSSAKQRGIEGC